jgi:integrase
LEKHIVETEKVLKEFEEQPWYGELKTMGGKKKNGLSSEEKGKYEEAEAKISKLSKEDRKCFRVALDRVNMTARPMKPATLRKLLITLGGILTYAVRMRYIDFNPCREIEKPKGNSLHEEKHEMMILKPPEIRALLNAAAPQKDKVLFMTAVLTGGREGEILGLQWGDIDWVNSQLFVRRTFNHGRFMEPKTKTSRRKIDLAPGLVHELKKWKLACPKGDLDLVFPSEAGTPWDNTNMVRRSFRRSLRKAGLPRVRFHDLRRTYASLLIDQGEHPKYIQTQMGHSSIKVTMDIYGHLMDTVNQKAASRLGKTVLEEGTKQPEKVATI